MRHDPLTALTSPVKDGSHGGGRVASDRGKPGELWKSLAHDLGNLAYRLTFLSANLEAQIPDPGHRDEAVALLRDTTTRLHQAIEKLREVGKNA